MTSNIFRWTYAKNNSAITSAISLITILFGARADVINQTEFPVLMHMELCPTAAYSECENGNLCLGYWNITKKCHSEYTNEEIIEKCEDFVDADFINDTVMFAPMTSTIKNITYLNVYCGICNFEKELFKFEFWTPWIFFKENENKSLDLGETIVSTKFTRPVDSTQVLDELKLDLNDDLNLISVFNETIHECNVLKVVPNHLKSYVKPCMDFAAIQTQVFSESVYVIRDSLSRILNQNYSDPNRQKFCLMENSSMESYCDYRDKNGDTCSINKFLSNVDFACDEDGFISWNSSKNTDILAQCSNHSSNGNYIYVCGPSKSNLYKEIKNRIFNILDHISIFFLFLYLVLSGTSKQNLRSLPKRIFYSYSVTLFAFYVLQLPLEYVKSCVMKYYLFFYTWQSYSFWILITSFDLWRLVYNSSKFQKVNVEIQTKRYVFYCILGWGLPALLLVALFPTLTQDQKSWSCPSVLGFENEIVCSSSCDLNKYTFNFGWVTIAIFVLLTPALLIMTCVLVCLSTRNTARSNVNRTYTIVLLKVSIMMGLHWTLLVYLTLFDSSERFSMVYQFISSFHGCFIFFAFGLDKNNLNRFKRVVCASRTVTEQTENTTLSRSTRDTRLPPD